MCEKERECRKEGEKDRKREVICLTHFWFHLVEEREYGRWQSWRKICSFVTSGLEWQGGGIWFWYEKRNPSEGPLSSVVKEGYIRALCEIGHKIGRSSFCFKDPGGESLFCVVVVFVLFFASLSSEMCDLLGKDGQCDNRPRRLSVLGTRRGQMTMMRHVTRWWIGEVNMSLG